MSLERTFLSAREALDGVGVPWALVGGLAVGVRTEPRFTRDVDLAVQVPDDAAAEDLLRELMGRGFRVSDLVEQTATGRLATARLLPAGTSYLVDLLFASSGIEEEVVRGADPLDVFSGIPAPVAGVAHLLALKVLARDDEHREQDRGDLRRLLRAAEPREMEEAGRLLELIQRRGYHRGKDLLGDLAAAVREFRVLS